MNVTCPLEEGGGRHGALNVAAYWEDSMCAMAKPFVNLYTELGPHAPDLFFEGFCNRMLCAKAAVFTPLRKYPATALFFFWRFRRDTSWRVEVGLDNRPEGGVPQE